MTNDQIMRSEKILDGNLLSAANLKTTFNASGSNGRRPSGVFYELLAKHWAEFVDCDKRLITEAPFLLRELDKCRKGVILDAGTGMGCESIFLLQKGFHVISNEIDPVLQGIAAKTASKTGVQLDLRSYDWRCITTKIEQNSIDAIILLGNSLCLLKERTDIKASLCNFFKLLKRGGCLIIDERNFPYIATQKKTILQKGFRYSGKYIYCGTKVQGRPIDITTQNVKFGYFHGDKLIGILDMYPFKDGELNQLLKDCGFSEIKQYSDFKEGLNTKSDFFTYLAYKK